MSLSQKHEGKVLVPWFNISEWHSVYNLIYSQPQNRGKALHVLKIWKLRTPLLSAGVEGTLILLEALLVDKTRLSSFETTHIFSTAIVRFLNLCAANSEKQGTFYKTALKNELPKWLISLRHDIAHSHKLPSISMLELSLKYCLDWLEDKYWRVQSSFMSDLVVNESDLQSVEDYLFIYLYLNNDLVLTNDIDDCINRMFKGSQCSHSKDKLLELVTRRLQSSIRSNLERSVDRVSQILIDGAIILSVEIQNVQDKEIPKEFVENWSQILDILYSTEALIFFVYKLFYFVCNESCDYMRREVASLWIRDIFQALINGRYNTDQTIRFTNHNSSMKDRNFVDEIMRNVCPFTLNFVKEVLHYNEAPKQFIDDCALLIASLLEIRNHSIGEILTVEDLNLSDNDNLNDGPVENENPTLRWQRIKDSSQFKNLPLGILPNQTRNKNPLLDFS